MNLLLSSEAEAAGQAMASPIVWVIYFAVLIGIFSVRRRKHGPVGRPDRAAEHAQRAGTE